jgi:hypothetical protein
MTYIYIKSFYIIAWSNMNETSFTNYVPTINSIK